LLELEVSFEWQLFAFQPVLLLTQLSSRSLFSPFPAFFFLPLVAAQEEFTQFEVRTPLASSFSHHLSSMLPFFLSSRALSTLQPAPAPSC
jgi:hypothetical protein